MDTTKSPLISIITVSFNAVSSIENTILSVLDQKFHDYEYIIIDGGSKDGTIDIIKKYQNQISFWISEPDKGIYDAMNKALLYANGTYIYYLNSGDLVYENTFNNVFENVKDSLNFDIIYGDIINSGTKKIVKVLPLNSIKYGMVFCHQAVLVKKSAQEMINFDLRYKIAADFNLFLKLYLLNKKFMYCNLCFGEYDNTGVSNTFFFKTIFEYLKIIWRNSNKYLKVINLVKFINLKKKFILYLIVLELIGEKKYNFLRHKLLS